LLSGKAEAICASVAVVRAAIRSCSAETRCAEQRCSRTRLELASASRACEASIWALSEAASRLSMMARVSATDRLTQIAGQRDDAATNGG
jgi:hypothetical protein